MPRYSFAAPKAVMPALGPDSLPQAPRTGVPSLETDYPRVLYSIQAMWGYPELNQYFRKLTIDERGDREGFPPEVWEEIYLLLHLHQQIVPESLF